MKINYGYEYAKFRAEQKKQREYYLSLGMAEEAIEEIAELDKKEFLARLLYMKHTQPLSVLNGDGNDDDSTSPLFEKFIDRLTVTIETYQVKGRYDWIDEIENPILLNAIKNLNEIQLELVTAIMIEGTSQVEVGKRLGISKQAVNNRVKRLKKYFKELLE